MDEDKRIVIENLTTRYPQLSNHNCVRLTRRSYTVARWLIWRGNSHSGQNHRLRAMCSRAISKIMSAEIRLYILLNECPTPFVYTPWMELNCESSWPTKGWQTRLPMKSPLTWLIREWLKGLDSKRGLNSCHANGADWTAEFASRDFRWSELSGWQRYTWLANPAVLIMDDPTSRWIPWLPHSSNGWPKSKRRLSSLSPWNWRFVRSRRRCVGAVMSVKWQPRAGREVV